VQDKAVQDKAANHMVQRCFYNMDLDKGKLLGPEKGSNLQKAAASYNSKANIRLAT